MSKPRFAGVDATAVAGQRSGTPARLARVPMLLLVCLLSACAPGTDERPIASPTRMPTAVPTEAPTPTATLVQTPRPMPPQGAPLLPGSYTLRSSGYRYTFTVPAEGWRSIAPDRGVVQGDHSTRPPDVGALIVWIDPMYVYLDPCQWPGTERQTGTTPEDWVAAIREVGELSPSASTDITVDGYLGKRIQITVAGDVDPSTCVEGEYRAYDGRIHLGATEVDDLWILGIPGGDRIVIVNTYFPATPEHVRDEIKQMMETLTIEPV